MAASTSSGRWAALGRRVVTALIAGPFLLLMLYVGGTALWVLTWALALTGSIEFSGLLRHKELDLPIWGIGLLTSGLLAGRAFHWAMWPLVLALFFLAALFGLGGQDNQRGFLTGVSALFGALYLGGLFSYMDLLRSLPHGIHLAIYVILVIWGTDAGAYFAGKAWGRHQLLPRVSPGKTWEGAVGGILTGIVAGALLWLWLGPGHNLLSGGVVGLTLSVAGQIGDLMESNLKRYVGAKDSGGLLPGHGGVLDRFDSALFAMPVAYYVLRGMGLS